MGLASNLSKDVTPMPQGQQIIPSAGENLRLRLPPVAHSKESSPAGRSRWAAHSQPTVASKSKTIAKKGEGDRGDQRKRKAKRKKVTRRKRRV